MARQCRRVKIVDDADVLPKSYRYPAEHWIHRHHGAGLAGVRAPDGVQVDRGR
ncbi:hypothetical protein MKSMC1_43020 [Mycobacterium kansasii]|nr:hypothetical protein MKSMC1_43020 [Mycobacterium kansasii]